MWLAARSALGANRETIEIVHLLGGTDGQIARIFQRSIGIESFLGGFVGLVLSLAAILLLGRQFAGLGSGMVSGGGLDPGESPTDGVVREVAEETGQVVDEVRLVDVMTQHWVGRSPRGLEDYHAVRLLHTARCERPTRPVVHDVGGSTSDARWVPLHDLGSVAVVASVGAALRAVGLA